jgi:hypothetical protein
MLVVEMFQNECPFYKCLFLICCILLFKKVFCGTVCILLNSEMLLVIQYERQKVALTESMKARWDPVERLSASCGSKQSSTRRRREIPSTSG